MDAQIQIREVTAADASSYFRLRVQSEEEYPQFVGFNAERELAAGPSGIAPLLTAYPAEGTRVFGAFDGAQLQGVCVLSRRLSPKYRHKAFLWGMYVVPEARGSGLAQRLMQFAIIWTRQTPQIVALSLQVTFSNVRGRQFYQKFGFVEFGREERALFAAGEFHGVYYMELDLYPAE